MILLALPGVLLAGLGLVHPHSLDARTAQWWSDLHVLLLPVFPLLGAAQWVLLAGTRRWVRWLGRTAAFGYVAFYTGLDAVAGIAAGAVVHTLHGRGPADRAVFGVGETLGDVGAWCFLLASVLIAVNRMQQDSRLAVAGGALLLTGSVLFLDSHIFWPVGVITMLLLAGGMALLGLVDPAAGSAAGDEAETEADEAAGKGSAGDAAEDEGAGDAAGSGEPAGDAAEPAARPGGRPATGGAAPDEPGDRRSGQRS